VKKFPRIFLLGLSVILLILALFSIVIDPYAAFLTPRIEGVNKYKLTALKYMRLVKPYHVNYLDYEVLVTGSSRAGRGVDCRYFLARGERCYNSALTGGGIYEAYRFLQQRPGQLEHAIVSLDFFVFLREEYASEAFVENRLWRAADGTPNTSHIQQALNDLFGLMFSRQTLVSSRSTWNIQDAPYINHRADGMLYLDDWGGWSFDPSTLDASKRNLRVNRQVSRYGNILDTMVAYYDTYTQDMATTGDNIRRQLEVYRNVLKLLYQHELQASLVLPPSHVSYWMIIRNQGLYPRFEQWKRNLVRINEEVASGFSRAPLPVFDFSGANTVAMSSPPQKNQPATFNEVFSDAMHFSRPVGDLMLDRALGACENSRGELFGYCITSDNIDGLLQRQDSLFRAYEEDNKD